MEEILNIKFSDPNNFYKRLENASFSSFEEYKVSQSALAFLIHTVKIEKPEDFKSSNILKLKPFPHQYNAAKKLWNDFRCRGLVADEVGLGKTLTALIIVTELLERGWAKSILILARKSHCYEIWKGEIEKHIPKYTDLFKCNYDEGFDWNKIPSFLICSHSAAKNNREIILKRKWDLVIIDEIHHFRNLEGIGVNPSQLAIFGKELGRSPLVDRMILITAIPLQNRLWDLYSLSKILLSIKFGTPRQFTREFIADDPKKARDVKNIESLRAELSEFMIRICRKDTGIPFPERKVITRRAEANIDEIQLYEDVSKYIVERLNQFSKEMIDKIRNFLLDLGKNLFKTNKSLSLYQLNQSFETIIMSENYEEIDRNTTIKNFRKFLYNEIIQTGLFTIKDIDEKYYQLLVNKYIGVEYIRKAQSYKLALIKAQEMAMSSPKALYGHLEIRLKNANTNWEINTLKELLQRTEELTKKGRIAKIKALLKVINELLEKGEKIIIFSRFKGTIYFIEDELNKQNIKNLTFTGDLSIRERESTLERFRNENISVLISTDVGAEGLNLQFCGTIVNFDLPWNPMVVEQRIGRIHRLGQERKCVFIYNLAVKDTIEDNIVLRLYEKLKLFELAIGEMDEVLSKIAEEETVEEVIINFILAVTTKKTEAEKEDEKRKMEQKIKEAQEKMKEDKIFTGILGSINTEE